MHEQAHEWVAARARRLRPRAVLEIGSLDINGSVRGLFAAAELYHGIDLVAGPGVDEVADAAAWRAPAPFDVVVCMEVLEHAPDWQGVLETAWTSLDVSGTLLMTCAGDGRAPHSAVDGLDLRPGEHYANLGVAPVLEQVARWDCVTWHLEHHADRGDLYLEMRRSLTGGCGRRR
jgi:Methyltransferase domain